MHAKFATTLLLIALIAAILPPGYSAYIGGYIALAAATLALLVFLWPERATLRHPVSLSIIAAIILVSAALPLVYRSTTDLLAPILLLPMLATPALGLLARPARLVPGPMIFASICLLAAFAALAGGAYEHFWLGIYRPGLGNNPIHYASLAAMAGGLALVGVTGGASPWRYLFMLGPAAGLACSVIADSRGPMLGSVAMAAVGILALTPWLWRDRLFRVALLLCGLVAAGAATYLVGSGNARVAGVLESALNIFRFTGGNDDVRAALYTSAVEILRTSPLAGVGLGQIMEVARTMFPDVATISSLENLHADWANFAAMAGGLGLLALLLLLAAPLLLLLDARARRDQPIVLGALLLTTGQMVLGVSNATFGVLPQTMVYAVPLGYFLLRARRLAMEEEILQSGAGKP